MFCPSCGAESAPDSKFCKSCGTALGAAGNAPAAASVPVPQAIAPAPPAPATYASPAQAAYPPPPPPAGYPPPPVYVQYAQAPPRKSSALSAVISLLVLASAVIGGIVYYEQNKKVIIGTKDEVYYSGSATKDQATALGNALKTDGYFQDKGVTVLLDKESSGTTISFIVKDGFWNEPNTLSEFEEIARTVASTVGGLPVQLNLDNSSKAVEKSSTIGEATFDGGDGVFYEGTATLAQAQAVGQQLKSIDYFQGHGANVFLVHHDDGTAIMFVVGDDAWDNPLMVTAFETIVRAIASSAGGFPIDMRLVTSDLTVKKDEVINSN